MGGTLYPIDSSPDKRNESLREVTSRLEDINSVLFQTGQTRRVELGRIAENLLVWKDAVMKEKAVYQTMNLLSYDSRKKTLLAEGWCPTRDITAIQQALRRSTVSVWMLFMLTPCSCSRALTYTTHKCTGNCRYQRPSHPLRTYHPSNPTYIPPNHTLHRRIPNHHRFLRYGDLSRSQSWNFRSHHLPVLVCGHVW